MKLIHCRFSSGQAGGITIAVEYVNAGKTRGQVCRDRARLDDSYAGMHRTICAFGIERVVADANAGHIGDGVERSGCARANGDA